MRVYDSEGKGYIEGLAGLWCTSLGFSNAELVEAARAQMAKLPFTHLFSGRSHDPAIELADKLKEIAPVAVSKIFFCGSGSEANDTQMKLAWYYNNAIGRPQKKTIVSRIKAYHGVTIASASLTGLPANHRDFDLPIANVRHAGCPHHYRFAHDGESETEFATRLARELEELILAEGPETIAAFIAEPVMGAGGVIVPPATYYEKVQSVLDRYDVLLDRRRGDLRLRPARRDVRRQRDGHAAGYDLRRQGDHFGLSAARRRDDSGKDVSGHARREPQDRHVRTWVHLFRPSGRRGRRGEDARNLPTRQYRRARRRAHSAFLAAARGAGDHPLAGEVRGKGLVAGIELVADKNSKALFAGEHMVCAKAVAFILEAGVITRAIGDTIAICPPLIISHAEIDEMFDKIALGLDRTQDWTLRQKLRG